MSDVREAAERLREFDAMQERGSVERLLAAGFERHGDSELRLWRHKHSDGAVGPIMTFECRNGVPVSMNLWRVCTQMPETMGALRRLCAALGINLKEGR